MLSGLCWTVKKQHIGKMSVAKMRTIRWMGDNKLKDQIKNENKRGKLDVDQ